MSTQLTLPRLGQGMETGTIVRWLKQVGDRVEKGEPLYELDTEKVTQEVEADAGGVLLELLAQEGEEVEVGKPIAVIGEEGEEPTPVPAAGDAEEGAAVEVATDEAAEEGEPGRARTDERERGRAAGTEEPKPRERAPVGAGDRRRDGARVKASPLARRIAGERGIDLSGIQGTGPEGRVVAEDVERAAAAPAAALLAAAAPGEVEVVKLTGIRRTIARRMTEAWEAPVFQISMSADMRASIRVREALVKQTGETGVRPTYSDVLTKLCALALVRHSAVNAHFTGDEIQQFPTASIGIAVAIPGGLVVPVIPSCERRTIAEIAEARADLVERTRGGKLTTQDLQGGTFTISNLGMYGVERFIAVINPPQVAILAVGAIEERPVAEAGEVVVRPRMDLTLTCDHRAVDGATASEFLRTLKSFVEEPGLAL